MASWPCCPLICPRGEREKVRRKGRGNRAEVLVAIPCLQRWLRRSSGRVSLPSLVSASVSRVLSPRDAVRPRFKFAHSVPPPLAPRFRSASSTPRGDCTRYEQRRSVSSALSASALPLPGLPTPPSRSRRRPSTSSTTARSSRTRTLSPRARSSS